MRQGGGGNEDEGTDDSAAQASGHGGSPRSMCQIGAWRKIAHRHRRAQAPLKKQLAQARERARPDRDIRFRLFQRLSALTRYSRKIVASQALNAWQTKFRK